MKKLYILLIFMGVIFVCSDFFIDSTSDNEKAIDLIVNLGIGIFPTGAIGLILEIMNDRYRSEIKKYKRQGVLKDFQNMIQNYLNVICNKYFELNIVAYSTTVKREISVVNIFTIILDFECQFVKDYNNKQIFPAADLIDKLYEEEEMAINELIPFIKKILDEKNIYITNEIFTSREIELIYGLKNHAEKHHKEISEKQYIKSLQNYSALLLQIKNILDEFNELKSIKTKTYVRYRICNQSE